MSRISVNLLILIQTLKFKVGRLITIVITGAYHMIFMMEVKLNRYKIFIFKINVFIFFILQFQRISDFKQNL